MRVSFAFKPSRFAAPAWPLGRVLFATFLSVVILTGLAACGTGAVGQAPMSGVAVSPVGTPAGRPPVEAQDFASLLDGPAGGASRTAGSLDLPPVTTTVQADEPRFASATAVISSSAMMRGAPASGTAAAPAAPATLDGPGGDASRTTGSMYLPPVTTTVQPGEPSSKPIVISSSAMMRGAISPTFSLSRGVEAGVPSSDRAGAEGGSAAVMPPPVTDQGSETITVATVVIEWVLEYPWRVYLPIIGR